jgi:hypothetical protein
MELAVRERGFACNPLHIMSNAISVTRVSRDDSEMLGSAEYRSGQAFREAGKNQAAEFRDVTRGLRRSL